MVFRFITNKPFWVNLLAAIVSALLLFFLGIELLGTITNHGESKLVPSVVGKRTSDAIRYLEHNGFEVQIKDSVYTDTARNGIVLKQLPDPNSTVKINRTILLTVNRVTLPLLSMPALEGKSLNFALDILKRSHLKLRDTIFRPDFMRGSVLEQRFKGDKIPPGSKIPWGSAVDLVIGSGLKDSLMMVPDLVGKTFNEVKDILQNSGILLGAVVTDPGLTDSGAAFIWKQVPPVINDQQEPVRIRSGQLMDLWISKENKTVSDSLKK